ncbi:hypothetical protein [Phytomonospora endophytica]|uniref:Uncharacterized protein n=1 Tax=Phytomonospora endophytica TaxID=714109 RepID=A0A841FWI8_9ACTN|nr:hypothetical protein [Phytomonospora endophytica]MBB6036849.1 hypothetical protein [Phytomonospora endophytica]
MAPREHEIAAPWRRTGMRRFLFAARMDGVWWVLRINGFPDHPLWTLFVDGRPRLDLDGTPAAWELKEAPALDEEAAREAVAPVGAFVVYGSEVGRPCDDPVCCEV